LAKTGSFGMQNAKEQGLSEPLHMRMICDRVFIFGTLKKLADNIGYPRLDTEFICLSLCLSGLIVKNNLFQKPNQK